MKSQVLASWVIVLSWAAANTWVIVMYGWAPVLVILGSNLLGFAVKKISEQ
jgi:hypothetical protein